MNLGELKALITENSDLLDATPIVIATGDHSFYVGNAAVIAVLKLPRDSKLHEWIGSAEDYGFQSDEDLAKAGGIVFKAITIE